MSKEKKIELTKENLLKALEQSLGIVTQACKIAKVSRGTFYRYYNEDPEFREQVDSIEDLTLDFVESQLMKQIKEQNTTATIFYLKTKGKQRGYIQTQQVHQVTEHRNGDNTKQYDISKLSGDEAVQFYNMLEKMEQQNQIEESITEVEVIDDDDNEETTDE